MSEKKKRPAALCSPLCKEEFNQPFDAFSRLLVLSKVYLLVFTSCSMDPKAYRQTYKICLSVKKVPRLNDMSYFWWAHNQLICESRC